MFIWYGLSFNNLSIMESPVELKILQGIANDFGPADLDYKTWWLTSKAYLVEN